MMVSLIQMLLGVMLIMFAIPLVSEGWRRRRPSDMVITRRILAPYLGEDVMTEPNMTTPEGRRQHELCQLNKKRDSLTTFMAGPTFRRLPSNHQIMLRTQSDIMAAYANILMMRMRMMTGVG